MKKYFLIFIGLIILIKCDYNYLDINKTYNLRDRGPAGGWIFYINPNWKTDGWKYLEAAPADADTSLQWLSVTEYIHGDLAGGGILETIGSGKNNTAKIMQYKGSRSAGAAEYCDSYSLNGYSDWFLPSYDELYEMYQILKLNGIGNFSDIAGVYNWSSSEAVSANAARTVQFFNGSSMSGIKTISFKVRAVRAF